jgi:D-arabinose 1-dehydrogenase-like Zn-dependent alcohol dehydrogenase
MKYKIRMAYLVAKLAELEGEIERARRGERTFRALSVALAVPQLVLAGVMTATALLESVVRPEEARVVVGALGIAHIAVQALAAATQCSSRAAAHGARRRALLVLRNDVQLALESPAPDTARIAARIAESYDQDGTCGSARAHASSSAAVTGASATLDGSDSKV